MSMILLVDDDIDSLWALRLVVEAQGHHVLLSLDGEDALRKASRYLPEVIVTDWHMSGLDGIGLCERLKLYPALAGIAVVFTSSELPPPHLSSLWKAFMRKPLDLIAVERCIDMFLTRRLVAPQHRYPPILPKGRWPAMPTRNWT
jgi:CheY-like chemotaxis protein